MTIKEEVQFEEYKRTFAEAYKQGFIDAISVCKTEPQTGTDFTLTYTCSFSDCENFKHFGFGEKCIECKQKQSGAMWKAKPL